MTVWVGPFQLRGSLQLYKDDELHTKKSKVDRIVYFCDVGVQSFQCNFVVCFYFNTNNDV